MFKQQRPRIGPSWSDRRFHGFLCLVLGSIVVPDVFDPALNWWRLAGGGVLGGLGGYLLATTGPSKTVTAEERIIAQPVDLAGVVLAALASGLFCYVLAAWYGLVRGREIINAADLFLAGVIALSVVGSVVKKRSPRVGRALFIAAVALVVLMMLLVGVGWLRG